MSLISQTDVFAAWNTAGKACLHCSQCTDSCLLKKSRNYLLNFTKNGRQIDKGAIGESFVNELEKPFTQDKLAPTLEAVEKLCQNCGENHNEYCFVNCARKSLQVLLHGKILPFSPEQP